jgi:hypothetical protein
MLADELALSSCRDRKKQSAFRIVVGGFAGGI